ncbi:PilN domain-containing protein [Egbenema bharatensis]|uniref:PilN domain-containing protein n=1 Tax=Egbenema bharatensis TaxID=3463334 RepID=UPI003A86598B
MYSLDVNFLNDRQDRPTEAGLSRVRTVRSSPLPLYLGLATMIALPALVGGFWLFLQNQNQQLAQEQAELDNQLTALNAQLSVINDINTQISQIDQENRALATVFDRIKPWSAVLQDVRGRVPSNVQIRQIEQVETEAQPTAAPATADDGTATTPEAPPPQSGVRIIGYAQSFNDVNDFVLTLQRSPFLNAGTVRMVGSRLVNNPTEVEISGDQTDREIEVELPRVVEYTIEGDLTNLPASALLQDLERTLSVGFATRIQALRDRGVIQP